MSKRILVIDHDQAFAEVAETSFASLPVTYEICTSGGEGFDKAKETLPDLIVLCLELPDMNGYMACKKLRDCEATQLIKIILTSATAKKSDFEKHQRLRGKADSYLQKPIDKGTLLAESISLLDLGNEAQPFTDELSALSPKPQDLDGTVDPIDLEELDPPEEKPIHHLSNEERGVEIENKRREVAYLRKEIEAFKPFMNELEQHREELESAKSKLLEKERQIKMLQSEGSNQYQDHKSHIQEFQNKIQQLENQLRDQQNTHDALASEKAELASEVKTLQDQLARQQESAIQQLEEMDSLRTQISENKQALENATKSSGAAESELGRLRADNAAKNQSIEELKALDSKQQSTIQQLEGQLGILNGQLQDVQAILKEKTESTAQHQRLLEEAQQARQKLEDELKDNAAAAAELKERNRILTQKMETITEKNLSLASNSAKHLNTITAMEDEHRGTVETLERQLAGLRESHSQTQSELETMRDKNTELEAQWQSLKDENEHLLHKIDQQESTHHAAIEELRKRHETDRESLFNEFQAEKTAWHDVQHQAQSQLEETKAELECARDDLTQLKGQMEKQAAQFKRDQEKAAEESQEVLAKSESSRQELAEELEVLRKQNDDIQNQLTEWEQRLDQAQDQHRIVLADLEKKHQESQEELQSQLADYQHKLGEMEGKVQHASQTETKLAQSLQEVTKLKLGHETLKNRIEHAKQTLENGLQALSGSTEELSFEED